MSELLNTAYKLLSEGFAVIPSGGGESGKAPIIKWEPYQSRLPDKKELEGWDYKDKPALWGIVTGSISGIVVIDADNAEVRAQIEATGIKPHVVTPRGGAHYYFQHPGYPVKTGVDLLPKIDIRADGGFVNCLGGKYHIVTLPARDNLFGPPGWHPLRLKVRHYLARDKDKDKDGMLVVIQGRLVELQAEEWKEEDLDG